MAETSSFEKLYREVAQKSDLTIYDAKLIVEEVFDTMKTLLKQDGELKIYNFGSFKVKDTPQTNRINPKTGEKIVVPAKKTVSFEKSESFKI